MSTPPIDWTFGPAPAADDQPAPSNEPRRSRPSPSAARRLSRRTWLLLGAVGLLAVALTAALPLIETARARRAVEQVVAAQEGARLAADWDALGATFAPDPPGWGVIHAERLRNGWLPIPVRLPGLRSDGQPGRIIRFQLIGPQLARADVERGFLLPDGTPATFAMPQFYQFAQAAGQPRAWRQTAPPAASLDQAQHIDGPRVGMTYYDDDGDLAAPLIADLGDVLVRACADWDCPAGLSVAVTFDASDPASAASPVPYDSLLGSLALQVILGRPSAFPNNDILLASRFTGGYPTNAAASRALRRVVGVQALIVLAQQMAPNTLLHGENTYLDAMIAREAARLGLDAPGLRQLQIANPLFAPDTLWSVPVLHPTTDGALPEALVVLNHVLAGRDPTDEAKLMHAFNTATDAGSWLTAGLVELSGSEGQMMLASALNVPFPAVPPPGFTPDVALSCPSGPLLATLAGQTAPLLAGDLPDSFVDAWSPDGQQLALRVSGRLSWLSLAHGDGQFLPSPSWQEGVPPVWASNEVLVYPFVQSGPDGVTPVGNSDLLFFNTRTSGYQKTLVNSFTYAPSPDGTWAALVGQISGSGSESVLSILPALGGQPVFMATAGFGPAWSADSQQLAFALRDGADLDLVVFDMVTRDKRTLWHIGPSNDAQLAAGNFTLANLVAAWPPDGRRLAAAVLTYNGREFTGWVGWLPLTGDAGGQMERLPAPVDGMYPSTLAYSPDGQVLAVNLFDSTNSRQGAALYAAAGQLLRWLPGQQAGPWAPSGHTLALIGPAGVSLLREPQAEPQALGPAGCFGLAWRP